MCALTYLLYIVFWEGMIWYGAYQACVVHGYTWWLWLLAALLSGSAYSPSQWRSLF